MLLDRLAERIQTKFTRFQLKALVTDTRYQGKRIILAKPQTFMNESGQATGSLIRYYKIPLEHLLVVHDDLDVPLGTLRMRPSGGAGGQKGIRSIIDHLGEETFPRLRIGVGRPPGRMDPADYLLQNFSLAEAELLDEILDRAIEAVITFIFEGIQPAMTVYNRIVE
jgi:PTH1 family peptidyl-tRNA hydrolase